MTVLLCLSALLMMSALPVEAMAGIALFAKYAALRLIPSDDVRDTPARTPAALSRGHCRRAGSIDASIDATTCSDRTRYVTGAEPVTPALRRSVT